MATASSSESKVINLVLAGGGVKGIALVGAVSVLEKAGYTFQRIAGTSAGAIVGGLLAAGFTTTELHEIMKNIPYARFRDESLLDKFGLPGKAASLLLEKGIYEGDYFCRWYADLQAQKSVYTFSDLEIKGKFPANQNYRLVALAADITRGKLVRFPWDLAAFDIDPAQQLVAEAVRASISFPFFYEPVMLGSNYLVDGGLLSNFPIDTFKSDKVPTIGIKLSARPGATDKPRKITGSISYAGAIIGTLLNSQDQIHMEDPNVLEQTIFVDTGNVETLDFDITPAKQSMLYQVGMVAATKFLSERQIV